MHSHRGVSDRQAITLPHATSSINYAQRTMLCCVVWMWLMLNGNENENGNVNGNGNAKSEKLKWKSKVFCCALSSVWVAQHQDGNAVVSLLGRKLLWGPVRPCCRPSMNTAGTCVALKINVSEQRAWAKCCNKTFVLSAAKFLLLLEKVNMAPNATCDSLRQAPAPTLSKYQKE